MKFNTKDTVEFLVLDHQGVLGYKSLVMTYTGPTVYRLDQNFPNPFNPSTTIYYQVPVDSRVKIVVFDILGREVRMLVDEVKETGYHSILFQVNRVASGTYLCRMVADPVKSGKSFVDVKKMLVLK